VNFGEVRNLSGWSDLNDIAQSDSKVLPDNLVHANFSIFELVINKCDTYGLLSLLSFDHNGITLEDFEFRHLGLRYLDGRVVIVG